MDQPVAAGRSGQNTPVILGIGRLSAPLVAALAPYRPVTIADTASDDGIDTALAARVEAIVAGGSQRLDPAWLARFPRLGVIALHGVGTDGIDLAAMRARGVAVSTTPGVLDDDVAELAVGLLLAVLRRIVANDRFVRDGRWQAGAAPPLGTRLAGRRVGLLGMGRIGRAIARRLQGFDVTLAYSTRHRREDVPHDWHEDPLALAATIDVLVVALPGGAATRGLVDAAMLAALGPAGILVNVGRGSAVDEEALVDALARGSLAGAGLDVFAEEPGSTTRFAGFDTVVLQPHQGSATTQARHAMVRLVVANLASWFAEGRVLTPAPYG